MVDQSKIRTPPVTRQRLQMGSVMLLAVLVGSLLVARAVFSPEGSLEGWLKLARIAFPCALTLAIVVIAALTMGGPVQGPPIARMIYPGIIAAASTVAIAALDLLAGVPHLPPLMGMIILAIIYWSRPRLLGSLVFSIFAGMTLSMALIPTPFLVEYAFTLLVSPFIALAAAFVLRKNVLPSEEKLHFLEEENKELWNLSYRDTLTGLFNRRYMQQTAVHIFQRAVRYNEPLHILMMDIDHFKRVNDKLGHAVGDEVLKRVAAAIQSFVRTSDTVARYGGEEFIAFIVQSNPELTQFVANRIRDGIANMQNDGVPWQITLSIGVAGLQEGDTIDSLINRADQFLYMSKQTGRNRVSGF